MRTDVVLDTNVLVAALRSAGGASRRVLDLVLNGTLVAHLTVPLALEYEAVLLRERRAFGLSYRDVLVLLAALVQRARQHEVYYLWRTHVRDPADAHVLEAAVTASCAPVLSFNQKDFPRADALGVQVVRPGSFLEALREAGIT